MALFPVRHPPTHLPPRFERFVSQHILIRYSPYIECRHIGLFGTGVHCHSDIWPELQFYFGPPNLHFECGTPSSACFRHFLGILRQISGISQPNLGDILCLSDTYLTHISGIYWAYLSRISGITQINHRQTWGLSFRRFFGKSKANFRHISGKSHPNLGHIFCKSHVYLWHISGIH